MKIKNSYEAPRIGVTDCITGNPFLVVSPVTSGFIFYLESEEGLDDFEYVPL